MRSVVIGGGGFIGSHLAEALLLKGSEVAIFDRGSARYVDILARAGAQVVSGDFTRSEDLRIVLEKTDVVYHLVSSTVPKTSNEDPIFDIETNLVGAVNLFSCARDAGVKKIIFTSSGGTVYGIPRQIPLRENHPTEPICSHGIVKLAVEKYAHLFWELYNLDYCVLRISNAYGERQLLKSSQGIIPMIIGNGLHGRDIPIWGDGSVIRDYIHVSDVVDALVKAAGDTGNEKVFNIGSGKGTSLNELLELIEQRLERPLKRVYQHGQAYDVPINVLDSSLAQAAMDWCPQIHIGDGLARTVEYIKTHLQEF
jgi:UDP-glucose 4-epimerase